YVFRIISESYDHSIIHALYHRKKYILDRLEGKWTGFVKNIDRIGKNFVGNPAQEPPQSTTQFCGCYSPCEGKLRFITIGLLYKQLVSFASECILSQGFG